MSETQTMALNHDNIVNLLLYYKYFMGPKQKTPPLLFTYLLTFFNLDKSRDSVFTDSYKDSFKRMKICN